MRSVNSSIEVPSKAGSSAESVGVGSGLRVGRGVAVDASLVGRLTSVALLTKFSTMSGVSVGNGGFGVGGTFVAVGGSVGGMEGTGSFVGSFSQVCVLMTCGPSSVGG